MKGVGYEYALDQFLEESTLDSSHRRTTGVSINPSSTITSIPVDFLEVERPQGKPRKIFSMTQREQFENFLDPEFKRIYISKSKFHYYPSMMKNLPYDSSKVEMRGLSP